MVETYKRRLLNAKIHWAAHGNCYDLSPNDMYPPYQRAQEKIAAKVCKSCPVKVQCLETALGLGETEGVWGQTTEGERKTIFTALRTLEPTQEVIHRAAVQYLEDKTDVTALVATS